MDVSIIKDAEGVKPNWTLISEYKNSTVDTLFELYAKDKAQAKIYYHLNQSSFTVIRKVLFEYANGDFKFVKIHKTYGISSNNKMYHSEKTLESIIYKNKKFYHYSNHYKKPFITTLSFSNLRMFLNNFGNDNVVLDYLKSKIGWIRFIEEDYMFHMVSFNTVIKNKLYNKKAMLRHLYRCPYPVAKFVHEYTKSIPSPFKYLKVWYEIRKRLINIESLTEEKFRLNIFSDVCKFSQMVGKTVNCSWGLKRFETEHNKWNKIIVDVLLVNEPLKDLEIHNVFREFAEYSGFDMLLTNHDLISEGRLMNHCVGTYGEHVNNGLCAIYRVHNHTLEVRKNNKGLYIGQYMGYRNASAPKELYDKVKEVVDSFEPSNYYCLEVDGVFDNDLPF
jgi:hypothetical protein